MQRRLIRRSAMMSMAVMCQLGWSLAVQGGEPLLQIAVQTIANGDLHWDFRQARTDLFPHQPERAITVMNQTKKDATHGYHDVFVTFSGDAGRTWSLPELVPSLQRSRAADQSDRVAADLWPLQHSPTNKILILGKVFVFEEGTRENRQREETAYAVFDPVSMTCGPLRTLELPERDHAGFPIISPNAGCNQPLSLENGEILLPVRYLRDPSRRFYTTIVARCRFDGEMLQYVEHGTEHTLLSGRGLYEPSVGEFQGRYYLTLRADDGAYVTSSADGVNFQEYQPWKFDDGSLLGSINTQQHWLNVGEKLHLVYTRKGAGNDDVMRFRAPLFIAQVDPHELCVRRATEQTVLPNDGGTYGNSGVCHVSEKEAWITCAEDGMKGRKLPGHSNTVFLAKIRSHSNP